MTFIPADALFKEKFATTTRTATTTLTADPDLSISLPIGIWLVSCSLKMDTDVGCMFKVQMTGVNCPQPSFVRWAVYFALLPDTSPGATSSGNLWFLTNSVNSTGTAQFSGSGAVPGDNLPVTIDIPGEVVNVSLASARIDISWAQQTSTAANLSMAPGSWVLARRLG